MPESGLARDAGMSSEGALQTQSEPTREGRGFPRGDGGPQPQVVAGAVRHRDTTRAWNPGSSPLLIFKLKRLFGVTFSKYLFFREKRIFCYQHTKIQAKLPEVPPRHL